MSSSERTVIYVTAPELHGIQASGASVVNSTNRLESTSAFTVGLSGACESSLDIKAPSLSIDVSGASSLNIKGETKDVTIDASGSSGVKGFDLLAENVSLEASGASHIDTYASVKLDGSASGASEIKHKGQATVNSSTSGASSFNKVE